MTGRRPRSIPIAGLVGALLLLISAFAAASGTPLHPTGASRAVPGQGTVTFTETGLPSGTTWTIATQPDNTRHSSSNTTIILQQTPGPHSVSVFPVGPYFPDQNVIQYVVPTSGPENITFTKQDVTVPPSDSSTPAPTGLFGLPPEEGNLVLIVLLVLVGAGIVVFFVIPRRPRSRVRETEEEDDAPPRRSGSSARRRSGASRRREEKPTGTNARRDRERR